MWSVLLILAVGMAIIMIDVPTLRRNKSRKELWAFSVLLIGGVALNIVVGLGVEVPSPLELIKIIYGPIVR
ncbi:hypothetical protein [Cohnella luojiensis]|uniref:Uncharacterized protein n=1 Tax=Cohnella luojiensis TaxID=652876 RepID=A0A4Y8M248_9BACL|nr:hypothetical protein [Cohnella luojiensis]TFE25984.1 hypothetical protein E2980_12535 [Cohnella luojiensis]